MWELRASIQMQLFRCPDFQDTKLKATQSVLLNYTRHLSSNCNLERGRLTSFTMLVAKGYTLLR